MSDHAVNIAVTCW